MGFYDTTESSSAEEKRKEIVDILIRGKFSHFSDLKID